MIFTKHSWFLQGGTGMLICCNFQQLSAIVSNFQPLTTQSSPFQMVCCSTHVSCLLKSVAWKLESSKVGSTHDTGPERLRSSEPILLFFLCANWAKMQDMSHAQSINMYIYIYLHILYIYIYVNNYIYIYIYIVFIYTYSFYIYIYIYIYILT